MMSVLGIDPSLSCTGLASLSAAYSRPVNVHRVKTKPSTSLGETRDRIRYITGAVLRFAPMTCLTVIEAPLIPHAQQGGAILERAWLFGMIVDQMMQRGPVVQVRASTRAKYGAGAGNADKAAVMAAVAIAFPNVPIRDDNEADALVLVAMGARYLGSPIDGDPTKAQLEAMKAVRWPNTPKEKKK